MIAYFDCFSGASGDMILGALVDSGLDLKALEATLSTLHVAGYTLEAERVVSKGISGTRVHVRLAEHDHAHRHLDDILRIVDDSGLGAPAKVKVARIFTRLAEAEAKVHGVTPQQIHFHEVGSVDAIVDICGAVVGLEMLGVEEAYCSPLPTGGGTVRSAHGILPVPAPATLELIRDAGAPLRPVDVQAELVTPTGAAILTTLCQFRQPRLHLSALGYGFGQKELPWANTLRLWLGAPSTTGLPEDSVTVIEANLDDTPGELLGAAMESLLGAGALDVYFTPIQMKKNRPAVKVSVIAAEADAARMANILLTETSTLGVRMQRMERVKCERWQETLETPYGPVLAKAKKIGERVTLAAEYADAVRVARERGAPLADVYAAVTAAALDRYPPMQPTT